MRRADVSWARQVAGVATEQFVESITVRHR